MKTAYTALILFVFCVSFIAGQTDCCTEIDRPEPGEVILDALSLCFLSDEIECFSMRAPTWNYPMFGCPSHPVENPHLYILFPNEDTIQLRIEATDCNLGSGIQVVLYKLISTPFVDDCINLNTQFSLEQLFCDGTTGVVEFIQTNAKDEIFYLLIDGEDGDICDFTIESLRGEYRSGPRDSVSLSGPSGLPEGYTAMYTAEQFSFDCFRTFDCQCGMCGLDTFGVSWTGPPGAIINPILGTLSADVTMGSQNGSLCIRIKDDCENLFQCIQLEVTPTENYMKCPHDFTFAHGEVYGSAGIYYIEEGNKIYEVIVDEYPAVQLVNFIDACIGDQLTDCLFNIIEYPETDNYCEFMENDTCKSVQTYITWHQSLDTTIYDTICYGSSVFFCGAEIFTEGTKDCDALSIYGCDSNTNLVLHILPPDSTFLFDTLCNGSERLFCGFDIDLAGVFSCQDTSVDGCIQFTILQVTVDPIDTTFIDTTLCVPEVLLFRGYAYSTEGIYEIEEFDAGGCLDRFIINLMYDEPDTNFVTDTVCQMKPYDFCGMSITDPGVYYCTFETYEACDSVVGLTLIPPPCGLTMIYSVLCPGEEIVLSDTIIKQDGIFIDASRFVAGCLCFDTLIVEYSSLGSSQIVASNELSCEVDSVDLSIQFDDVFFTFNKTDWYFEGQFISDESSIFVKEGGSYFVIIEYAHVFIETCIDTLFYELSASSEFNPTLEWHNRSLVICDSLVSDYYLEFESDAPRSILRLHNTNEEWIDQSSIRTTLPGDTDTYNFRLILRNESGACIEIINFEVSRLSLETMWSDTIYNSDVRTVAQVENPLINLNPPATNVSFSPSNFIDGLEDSNIIFNALASGPFNLSFRVGDCDYNYNTVVVRNSIFVPNAFSPNNDGINDQFLCFTSAGFSIDELKIFNRWGAQVFSSSRAPITWNGRSNDKEMPAGVYIVQYKYSDRIGNVFAGVSELMLIK